MCGEGLAASRKEENGHSMKLHVSLSRTTALLRRLNARDIVKAVVRFRSFRKQAC